MNFRRVPQHEALVKEVELATAGYDSTTVMYLDKQGKWRTSPKTVRDRIANELWHSVWISKRNEAGCTALHDMIRLCTTTESAWSVTCRAAGFEPNGSADRDAMLIVCEVLYQLFEYESLTINSDRYVAEWDYAGKKSRIEYLSKAQRFLSDTYRVLDGEQDMAVLREIHGYLQSSNEHFINISRIIAEEERVRLLMSEFVHDYTDAHGTKAFYAFMNQNGGTPLRSLTTELRALLRPCLEILADPDLPIASGLQYETSDILGKLCDIRSYKTLTEVLERLDLQYTNVRSNVIYAMGQLLLDRSINVITDVLEEPDFVDVYMSSGMRGYKQPLHWEKSEAIWALGKFDIRSLSALDKLVRYRDFNDRDIRLALAWALGNIGHEQKKLYGGVDANVVTTLINMLTDKDVKVFEEVACSLRDLGLPDFLHSLYLHSTQKLPVLALKPSSVGLYELSESIFHLSSVKKPLVVAVTGDSGTGKTYFCDCLTGGFGDIQKEDILYLMRDHPGHTYLFDRLMGIRVLKEFLDPEQYQDYPLSEENDNPEEYFADFMKKNENKKLIILDGWMDESYFYQVLKVFYAHQALDIIVNFRTTHSTKRINLEEREGSLERVKTCLSYIENPVIEDTEFYRNGDVLIYNLDNSLRSRLDEKQIIEIFARQKVKRWGDYIRLGVFRENINRLGVEVQTIPFHHTHFECSAKYFTLKNEMHFMPDERHFTRILNSDLTHSPCLLQTIQLPDVAVNHIAFYTQGQLAYGAEDGSIGILSGFNDRMFSKKAHDKPITGITVLRDYIASVDTGGCCRLTQFDTQIILDMNIGIEGICSIASDRDHLIVMGHDDGSITLLDIDARSVTTFSGSSGAVLSVAIDRFGNIYSGHRSGQLNIWSLNEKAARTYKGHVAPISSIALYPGNKIMTGINARMSATARTPVRLRIIDTQCESERSFALAEHGAVTTMNSCFDGRIISGISVDKNGRSTGAIVAVDPRETEKSYTFVGSCGNEITGCIIIGPRIITICREDSGKPAMRIWGTPQYVRQELDKLRFMPDTAVKPAYYRTVF
jgi:hypothetical protein